MAVTSPVGNVKNSVPNWYFCAKYIDTQIKCIIYLFIYLFIYFVAIQQELNHNFGEGKVMILLAFSLSDKALQMLRCLL